MQSSVKTSRDDLTNVPSERPQTSQVEPNRSRGQGQSENPSRPQGNTQSTISNTQRRSRPSDSQIIAQSDSARQHVPVARYSETQQGVTDTYKSHNSLQRQSHGNHGNSNHGSSHPGNKQYDRYQSLPRDMHRAHNSTYKTYPVNVTDNYSSSTLPRRVDDPSLR